MKSASTIFWGIISATVIFVVVGLVVGEFTDKSASKTFTAQLEDNTYADVIILTSTAYNEMGWIKIKHAVLLACEKTSDLYEINDQLPKILELEGYNVITVNVSRKINRIE